MARLLTLLTAAVVLVTPAPAQAHAVASPGEFEPRLLQRINEVRRDAGLHEVRHESCVDAMAEQWSRHVASSGTLQHRDQDTILRRCDQVWAGENLVRGSGLTPAAVVEAWMASPDHREVMMKKRARRVGVAVSRDDQGRLIGVLNVTQPR